MCSIRKLVARKECGISTKVFVNTNPAMVFSYNQSNIECISIIKKFPLWRLADLIAIILYNEDSRFLSFIRTCIGEISKNTLLMKYTINKEMNKINNFESVFVYAALKGNINIVKILIAYGIDLNSVGPDAIVNAAAHGRCKIFKLLIKLVDYDPALEDIIKTIIHSKSTKMLKMALKYNVFNRYSLDGYPLNLAIRLQNTSMIKILLNHDTRMAKKRKL